MVNNDNERRVATEKHGLLLIGLVGLAFVLTAFFSYLFSGNVFLNLILVPGVLIACMKGYKNYCINTLKLSDEETGDALYYLGFLFTAAALAAGIMVIGFQLQRRGGIAGGDVIVSFLPSFEVALLTTIVGLCWRVVLSRGIGEIDTVYEDIRKQLLDAASGLTEQTKLTTEQFQVLLTVLRQKSQEVEQEFTSFTDSMSAAFSQSGMQDSAAQLTKSAETLHKAAGALTQSSKDADSRLESAIETLTAAARQMNTTAAAQAQAVQDVSALAAGIRSANQDLLAAFQQEAQGVKQELAGFKDSMTAALNQGGVQNSAVALKESAETLRKAADALSFGQGDMVRSAVQLRESAEGLQKVAEAMESSKPTDSLLEPAVRNLTAAATQLNTTAAAQTQAIKDIAALAAGIRPADGGQAASKATWTAPKIAALVIALVTGAAVAVWAVAALLLGDFFWWRS